MTLVLDASILVKLFREEEDSGRARDVVRLCAQRSLVHVAPSLLLYELLSVALHFEIAFAKPNELLTAMKRVGFRLLEPNTRDLYQAETIATSRSASHGYAELKDCIYHAMAITRNGTFLTADKRHHAKTQSFGHCQLLADWKPA